MPTSEPGGTTRQTDHDGTTCLVTRQPDDCHARLRNDAMPAAVVEERGAPDKLESIAFENGARCCALPHKHGPVALERYAWRVWETVTVADAQVAPFQAGSDLWWGSAGRMNRCHSETSYA